MASSLMLPGESLTLAARAFVLLITGIAVYFGTTRHQPGRRWKLRFLRLDPWGLLWTGFALHTASKAIGSAQLATFQHPAAQVFASLATMAAFCVSTVALVEMLRQRMGDRAVDHVFESVIAAGTASLLIWVTIIEPVLRSASVTALAGASGAISITAVLVLACLSLHLHFSFPRRRRAFEGLVVSQALPVLGALFAFIATFTHNDALALIAAAIPSLAVTFLALAALEPTMALYEEPSGPAGARLSNPRLAGLIIPVLAGPAMLTLCLSRELSMSTGAIAAYSIILSLLVVTHLIAMVQARASSTHWASHDKLTGLPNRALFRERTAQALERSRKMSTAVAVVYLDLDRFKHVNDSMGHAAGDQLLEQVARRILSCVDPSDTVARLGGDEFAILLTSVDDEKVPIQLARRLLKTFTKPFPLRPRPVFMSPSLGIAVSSVSTSLETLLTQADTAMYRSKEAGRNNFTIWSQDMNEAADQRLMLESHLHSAISNGELSLVYQPKVELSTGRIAGVEALVRWTHPKLGPISPETFIHLAEESGLINQIGEWVLETACIQGRSWYEAGYADLVVAVNLSSRQFNGQTRVADMVSSILRSTRMVPDRLELELTESVAMSGDDQTLATLHDLRQMGVKCSIDDFGTGYSNLNYLSKFPIDSLKIDRSFIDQINDSGGDAAIAVAIIAMAHGLDLKVVAEGVETPAQAAFLARHGCDQIQGYLFSRPLPATELTKLLAGEKARGPAKLGQSPSTAPKAAPSTPPAPGNPPRPRKPVPAGSESPDPASRVPLRTGISTKAAIPARRPPQ